MERVQGGKKSEIGLAFVSADGGGGDNINSRWKEGQDCIALCVVVVMVVLFEF